MQLSRDVLRYILAEYTDTFSIEILKLSSKELTKISVENTDHVTKGTVTLWHCPNAEKFVVKVEWFATVDAVIMLSTHEKDLSYVYISSSKEEIQISPLFCGEYYTKKMRMRDMNAMGYIFYVSADISDAISVLWFLRNIGKLVYFGLDLKYWKPRISELHLNSGDIAFLTTDTQSSQTAWMWALKSLIKADL